MIFIRLTEQAQTLHLRYKQTNKKEILKTVCGSDEPHPSPERNSPTRVSTSQPARCKGQSCTLDKTKNKCSTML